MPDAGLWATGLLILGLFLLALELMIPSFGMIGIMSAISLLVSAWCAWQAWWGTDPGFFWTYVSFWILGIPGAVGIALFLLQNTKLGDHLVLRPPESDEPAADDENDLTRLIGQTGTADSLLTPGGIVIVDGARFHAESRGMLIEPGTQVTISAVRANRLVVREFDGSAAPAPATGSSAASGSEQESLQQTVIANNVIENNLADTKDPAGVLDFDIPDN